MSSWTSVLLTHGAIDSQTIVFVKTVKDYYAFNLTFPIPDQSPLYKTQPARVIAHFLGHEGPGSVCAYLKKKGWLVSINVSPSHTRGVPTLSVVGKLTKEGYSMCTPAHSPVAHRTESQTCRLC